MLQAGQPAAQIGRFDVSFLLLMLNAWCQVGPSLLSSQNPNIEDVVKSGARPQLMTPFGCLLRPH